MIGSSEAGLTETIEFVLQMFNQNEQLVLANNIFLTGGCANFPGMDTNKNRSIFNKYKMKLIRTGLHDRLSREMLEMRPFQTPHKIYTAKNPNCDAWYGARQFANANDLPQFMITKQDYAENGGEYFKEHKASNLFCATPDPTVLEVIE